MLKEKDAPELFRKQDSLARATGCIPLEEYGLTGEKMSKSDNI